MRDCRYVRNSDLDNPPWSSVLADRARSMNVSHCSAVYLSPNISCVEDGGVGLGIIAPSMAIWAVTLVEEIRNNDVTAAVAAAAVFETSCTFIVYDLRSSNEVLMAQPTQVMCTFDARFKFQLRN